MKNPEVKKLYEILNAEDQGLITKQEATDLGFAYMLDQGYTRISNDTIVDIYFCMVAENIDSLQWNRWTKQEIAEKVAELIGKDKVEFEEIDEGGLVCDYAFLCGIFENYGYVDIYYLIPPIDSEVLLITGTEVSEE